MKHSICIVCLIMAIIFCWYCGGAEKLSKSQITKKVMDTLEKSVGEVTTVEGYPSFTSSKGKYQEIIEFYPTVGIGSPENESFYVIVDIGELKEHPVEPGEKYQKVGKYRITGKVTKQREIVIEGLRYDTLEESFVIEVTNIDLLPK